MSEIDDYFNGLPQSPPETGWRIAETRVGKGVFASRPYPVHSIIGEITGQRIADPDYSSDYCMDLEDGYQLEPYPPFRFVNHCCEPSCEFDLLELDDDICSRTGRRVYLIARRDIHTGKELTIDYNWPASAAIRCLCDAPSCRGWIIDEAELDDLLAGFSDPCEEPSGKP